jgi:hypothetical protein
MGSMKKKKSTKKQKSDNYNPKEWDFSKSVEVKPEKNPIRGISTSIRLPHSMVQKLRKIAQKKGGIGYQTLLKIWIAERLEQESA